MGVGFGLAGLYACFMLCCWKNISLGASIMEAASDFVGSNLRIITLPIFAYIIALIFFAYWIVTAIYLYGVGGFFFFVLRFEREIPTKRTELTNFS